MTTENNDPNPNPNPNPDPNPNPAPADPAAGAGGDPAPAETRPDFIPEKFWDAEAGQPRLEAMAKSYAEMERTRGNVDALKQQWEQERLGQRPEQPDAYTLPESEIFDSEALSASPVVEVWRRAAHEAGLGQEQFAKVIEDYGKIEVERMQAHQASELAKLGENAKARTEAVGLWASKTFTQPGELEAVQRIASDAAGVAALERIMALGGDTGGSDGGDPAPTGGDTLEEIRKLMDTPEYFDSSRRDPKVVERVQAFFAKAGK